MSLWVRDIELTAEQRQALLERNPAGSTRWRRNDKECMLVISNALTIAGLACLAVAIS